MSISLASAPEAGAMVISLQPLHSICCSGLVVVIPGTHLRWTSFSTIPRVFARSLARTWMTEDRAFRWCLRLGYYDDSVDYGGHLEGSRSLGAGGVQHHEVVFAGGLRR